MELKTERLTLRRVAAEDWSAIQAIWADIARSPYAQYDKPKDLADEAVRPRIARWASFSESREHLFFAVCLGGTVIGYIALNRRPDSYEAGYCFHSSYHGKGYARESLASVLAYAKEQDLTARITAGTALANTPSVNLLTALGFRLEGTETVSFYRDAEGHPIPLEGGIFVRDL